jgi:hypothetical protein
MVTTHLGDGEGRDVEPGWPGGPAVCRDGLAGEFERAVIMHIWRAPPFAEAG